MSADQQSPTDNVAPVAQTTNPLERGEPTGVPELMAVAGLTGPQPLSCTATLIGERIILTAAHCVFPFGSGCAGSTGFPEDIAVDFADANGDPTPGKGQRIRVLGFAVHPDAWGDRVTSCQAPVPPLAACPADASPFGPSCNLVEQCLGDASKSTFQGFHLEHDLALGYLESAPTGVEPLPVIVSAGLPVLTAPGMHTFPDLLGFIDSMPVVTLVGYGGGSTPWPPQNWAGRDYGTAHLVGREINTIRWDDCSGERGPTLNVAQLVVAVRDHRNAYPRHGDSGGPLLVGPGTIGDMEPPTALPGSSGLEQRRYVIGVDSLDLGDAASPGTRCNPLKPCQAGEECVDRNQMAEGACAKRCNSEADCADDAACRADAAPGQSHCRVPIGSYATTFSDGNGLWLSTHLRDIDGDGVSDTNDNCRSVPNKDQANCNRDAELDRQGDVLGDACDPVPCPAATAPVSFEVTLFQANTKCSTLETVRQVRRDIDPAVLGSHNPFSGAEVAQPGKRAAFRFCVASAFPFVNCSVLQAQRKDLHFDLPDASSIWHEVTLPSLGPSGAFATWDYPSDPASISWDYWADRSRWIANGWLVSSEPAKPSNIPDPKWTTVSDIAGAFGLRAGLSRSHDMLGTSKQNVNGIHYTPDLGDGYAEGEGLARAYIDMAPDAIIHRHAEKCAATCAAPFCADSVLVPLRWCAQCVRPQEWWNSVLPVDGLLARASTGDLGLVDEKSRIVVVDGLLSGGLESRLADANLTLVAAVEPYLNQGAGYFRVQGVFLSADGTATDGEVVATDDGFRLSIEEERGDAIEPSASLLSASRPLDGISPRAGFAAVLSKTLGALIIVGGEDAATRRLSRDIWIVPQWGVPTRLLVAGYSPERVLAATVAPADGMLWILDERSPCGWLHMARMVRIDPSTGQHEVVWPGPRIGLFDRHWLAADRDGQVLLFASSSRMRRNVAVRFEADPFVLGTAHAVLARFGQGALLGAPLVDHFGYQIVTSKGADGIRSERISSLGQRPGLVVDLSQCL